MSRTARTEPQYLYSTAIPVLPVWAVRPVQSLNAFTRVHFTLQVCELLHLDTHRDTRGQCDERICLQLCLASATEDGESSLQLCIYVYLVTSFGNGDCTEVPAEK